MSRFQEFFFMHSDKDVPSAEEARRDFPGEFAELVNKKSQWMNPLMDMGMNEVEIAQYGLDHPETCDETVDMFVDGVELFSILDSANEIDRESLGYKYYKYFVDQLIILTLKKGLA